MTTDNQPIPSACDRWDDEIAARYKRGVQFIAKTISVAAEMSDTLGNIPKDTRIELHRLGNGEEISVSHETLMHLSVGCALNPYGMLDIPDPLSPRNMS